MLAIDAGTPKPVPSVASEYDLARQTVSEYLSELVRNGQVKVKGKGRGTQYKLVEKKLTKTFPLSPNKSNDELPEEHLIWEDNISPFFKDILDTEYKILNYGFTEMVNNAVDHSEGTVLSIIIAKSPIKVSMLVEDNGVGIFRKLSTALKLANPKQAFLELSKGKFTTDPARHTGEGIFFTSRIFDYFGLRAGNLAMIHRGAALDDGKSSGDWLIEDKDTIQGTQVLMQLLLPSTKTLQELISEHSSGPDEYILTKTNVPLSLARYGRDDLISRSQAKRVLLRAEEFTEYILDFNGVPSIGQAFADEIFRVFYLQHPEIKMLYVRANPEVEQMIRRAITNRTKI
jgi:anti-sigma regulatory factor (Ser/Thr protein kinase)